MGFVDGLIVFVIISFGILLIWSVFQKQKIIDILYEIKEFMQSFKESV